MNIHNRIIQYLEEIEGKKSYKLKQLFYALRTAITCLWIAEKEEVPPIYFPDTLSVLTVETELVKQKNALIILKSKQDEAYLHSGEEDITQFIKHSLLKAESMVQSLPSSKGDITLLDSFFIKML